MSGRGGGGRDRFWRDNPSYFRLEEKSSGRSNTPPSRHLWVGNLSHSVAEKDLTKHFLKFGDIDSVAFQPGRSYAFINFHFEEDAIAASKALQGCPVAGNPLRIEFAKADKSSSASRGEEYSRHRDDLHSAFRGSSFEKDSRGRHLSPEPPYPDKSKTSDKSLEPSEVLWIGFPASLKVDEMVLRKAFSPFGEIEKITTFPGRSYAFVRFQSVMSACRAKDTLQGKLFGNPRVNICFAKSEAGSSNSGRSLLNAPHSAHIHSSRLSSSEKFRMDQKIGNFGGDSGLRSPNDLDSGEYVYNFRGKHDSWSSENRTLQHKRLREFGYELGPLQDIYDKHVSPVGERGNNLHDMTESFPQRPPIYEDAWDLPEDPCLFHDSKRFRTGSITSDNELPEYAYNNLKQEQPAYPRLGTDIPQTDTYGKGFDAGLLGHKEIPDQATYLYLAEQERNNHLKSSYDGIPMASGLLPENPLDRKRFTPEIDPPSLKEWKWEGTIAKGGKPICRARCFPVGKVLDFMLPEVLDCTARTSLDMLAKHYYQASGSWVVFFVPETDAEIGFYNEFMHYLEDKQRATVSRLDEKNTLFLVPPSEFSEKVLKVPGRLSISGVVLRLDHGGSSCGPPHHADERKDISTFSYQANTSPPSTVTPSGTFPSAASIRNPLFPGNTTISTQHAVSVLGHASGRTSDSYKENRFTPQENPRLEADWSSNLQNEFSGTGHTSARASYTASSSVVPERQVVMPGMPRQAKSSHFAGHNLGIELPGDGRPPNQETKPLSSSLSLPLPPDQLAQLASSLLEQQRQLDSTPKVSMEDPRRSNVTYQSVASQQYGLASSQATYEPLPSNFSQAQLQQPQMSSVPGAPQSELQAVPEVSQQMQGAGATEAGDTQKRLQATLQLAAALLQQVQGKRN